MKINRIKFSKEASDALNKMKGKVGISWNLICRIGFCMSLDDMTPVNPKDYKADGSIEIEKKILIGQEEELYYALLKQRCLLEKIEESQYVDYFKAHMNRGVLLISKRVGTFKDLAQLLNAA
jgi:DNA sulfur modification protein DndE